MRNFLQFTFVFILLPFSLFSCATYSTQYATHQENKTVATPAASEIEHSFYLIGDAGLKGKQDFVLNHVAQEAKNAKKNSTLLFLGDNIYTYGMPKKDAPDRKEKEEILDAQINLAKKFNGNTIFVPGNHDWYSGLDGVKRQQKYIEKALGKHSFYPRNGSPLKRLKIGDEIVLIIIDSQWYITNWNNHPTMNDDSNIKTKKQFWDEFESEIKKADGKTTLIAIHNPVFTNGSHGGQYSFKSHLKPIPVLGTLKNIIRKTGGVSNADNQNKLYRELSKRLKAYSQFNNKVIFVSGHDHNLQFLKKDNVTQIISGSGAKSTPTRLNGGGLFTSSDHGYARLDIMKDGSSHVHFYSSEQEKELYATEIYSADKHTEINYTPSFKNTQAKIYPDKFLNKSGFYKFIWGDRYRKYFGTEVTVPSVDLTQYLGGLTPVRKGGGHQSLSLHMKDKNGKQYVMRALRKSATQYIQAVGFKDQFMGDSFNDTKTEALLMDVFTGSHPYAPFTIAELSHAVGILHTNPKLVYVPKQNTLGKFNHIFGDDLYMIEEKVTSGHGDLESFANANKVISTFDVFKHLRKDEDKQVDQKAFLRARLFDMFLGDWDRHQDQWKWAVKKDGKKELYIPIPRDRDQAFSNMADGALMSYITRAIPVLGLMQKFTPKPQNIKRFNLEPYPLDVAFLEDITKEDWDNEIQFLQKNLTDEVIEKAIHKMPVEVQDETVEKIISVLKQRRDNLPNYGINYFKTVNKTSTIIGTDKDDWFKIERLANGNTSVSVYNIKNGKKKKRYQHKIFNPEYTKEIWLYGLDDKDIFHVFGDEKAKIKVRIIGGQNHDKYNIEKGSKVIVYDYKSKKSSFKTNKGKKRLTDDYQTNVYDYHKQKYNDFVWAIPAFKYNPDNGIMFGPSFTLTTYNFEQNPFTQQHKIQAKYMTATKGYEMNYLGEFARITGSANLMIDALYQSPFYSKNFFGYGMNSEYNEDINFEFYQTRIEEFHLKPSLKWKRQHGQSYQLGLSYQNIGLEKMLDRSVVLLNQISDADFEHKNFIGTFGVFNYQNKDNAIFPSLAMTLNVETGYNYNITNKNGLFYINPSLGFSHKLIPSGKLVLATMFRGQINSSDNVAFYQSASIGGNNGLRGFYNQRFAGQYSYTQSSDLRLKLGNLKTAFVPVSYGIYGGIDYGKVWSNHNINNQWETSYGGGFFINGANMIGLNVSYFKSTDGGRIVIGTGFGF